ncbi:N-acetylmuramidase family protein [Xylophilus sp. GOD-11R]|uniref:N-acetylmuramidase family protein n=1 Tax=Xylophilus sp. GOD-11R TaxID=3089814 RepID=UPI00298C119D|nr:N-acetylmuramidase family protein [Xylophilus sp. GOD-11R]WPB58655.1 N-acetylmuramidase family protein [Xylophilus sp. GOD-11R]
MTRYPLSETDFALAAAALGCAVPAVKAVCIVEAPGGGFQDDGQVRILFEGHVFHRLTGGRFDAAAPDLSNVKPGGYGLESSQHDRLQRAVALNRDAALRSASWGKFQIMGFNFPSCGFGSLQSFINAMHDSESAQLDAFVEFILANPGLARAIRAQDWTTFARLYNGPDYAKNQYDVKLAKAFTAAKASA